jgi:hypothetical protein
MTEEEQCWTGINLLYTCPNCHKPDRQTFVFLGGTYDDSALDKARERMAPCKRCKAALPQNLEHECSMTVGTLEQLRKAGYPVPSVQ